MAAALRAEEYRLAETVRTEAGTNGLSIAPLHCQLGDICRLGVMPPFTDVPIRSQTSGFPHQRAHGLPILGHLWKNIRHCEYFVVDTEEIHKRNRIELSPPRNVLKRNPDRSFSQECRVISD